MEPRRGEGTMLRPLPLTSAHESRERMKISAGYRSSPGMIN